MGKTWGRMQLHAVKHSRVCALPNAVYHYVQNDDSSWQHMQLTAPAQVAAIPARGAAAAWCHRHFPHCHAECRMPVVEMAD